MAYGFKNGKNKSVVFSAEQVNALLSGKEPVHQTAEITLLSSDWAYVVGEDVIQQDIAVPGVTSSSVVFVAPSPRQMSAYTGSSIVCVSQADGELTFQCAYDAVPAVDIVVNVVIFGGNS